MANENKYAFMYQYYYYHIHHLPHECMYIYFAHTCVLRVVIYLQFYSERQTESKKKTGKEIRAPNALYVVCIW